MPTIQTTLRMFLFISRVIASGNQPPTIAELQRQFDVSSPASVHAHLKKMEAQGWIKRSRAWRGIEIVDQEKTKVA